MYTTAATLVPLCRYYYLTHSRIDAATQTMAALREARAHVCCCLGVSVEVGKTSLQGHDECIVAIYLPALTSMTPVAIKTPSSTNGKRIPNAPRIATGSFIGLPPARSILLPHASSGSLSRVSFCKDTYFCAFPISEAAGVHPVTSRTRGCLGNIVTGNVFTSATRKHTGRPPLSVSVSARMPCSNR